MPSRSDGAFRKHGDGGSRLTSPSAKFNTGNKMSKAALLEKNEARIGEASVPQWVTGKIKWFDRTRRYGFVYFDDSDEEAFLAWTSVQESNIRESALMIGTRVRFTWTPPRRQGGRPEVVRLALIDRR